MNFAVIAEAGITQAQFGALVGVTRVTVNTWVTGKFGPRPAARDRVLKALGLIAAAIAAHTLPAKEAAAGAATEAQLGALATALRKPRA